MSDILSTFLSPESSFKKNKYNDKLTKESNKVFLNNGLRLSKEGNILKLPKFNNNFRYITENNKSKSYQDLDSSNQDEILIINDENNNTIFKNKYLSELSSQNDEMDNEYKKYNKIKGNVIDNQMVNNKNKNSKSKYNNKYISKENTYNIHELDKEKQKFIDNYIESLLSKGKKRSNKFNEAAKKIQSYKFSMANSINPKKYIQKQILDDSFNCNDFRTSKIQRDCFNGNEKFREANYKNIKINIMNNIFLNSMKAVPEKTDTEFLLDKMISEQKHINKFNFSKNTYTRNEEETLNSNNNNIVF